MRKINKVLAINGSPRASEGMTDVIVKRFLAGAEAAGAATEVVYPAKMKIAPCIGCLRCWFETPGVCRHKDDMPALMAKLPTADLVVLASPVYVDGMNAQMKAMFDRMVAYTPPFFEQVGERTYHPKENPDEGGILVISTCGFPEREHFQVISLHFKRICENMRVPWLGELLFPAASLIASEPELVAPNLAATERAGREVVERGELSPETLAEVNREYVDDPIAVGKRINEVFHLVRKHHGIE